MKLLITSYALFLATSKAVLAQDICISDTGNYTVVLDLYAGELGYFTFEECPGVKNPTIGIEYGTPYRFIQKDRSNWFHPMGFAYFPDGAHDDADELEPGISQTGSNCVINNTCPTPLYFRDGVFLGDPLDKSNFGLDVYEPEFFLGITTWSGSGEYSVMLTFDDEAYTNDIFYFCHIHQYMTGRIKLLKNGVPVNETDAPTIDYVYDTPGEFDKQCGTYGLDNYELPNLECPETFVCLDDITDPALVSYASCIDAMNCAMVAGMTTKYSANSPVALFIHQMIPHHQNAVNMAKVLLKQNILKCDDLTNEEDPDCIMEAILRDITATQNFQIQGMTKVLELNNFAKTADCVVEISRSIEMDDSPVSSPVSAPTQGSSGTTTLSTQLLMVLMVSLSCFLSFVNV